MPIWMKFWTSFHGLFHSRRNILIALIAVCSFGSASVTAQVDDPFDAPGSRQASYAIPPSISVDDKSFSSFTPLNSVRNALEWRVTVEFVQTPLAEAVRTIGDKLGFDFLIDVKALDDSGIPTDKPITITVRKTRLKDALSLMLQELELSWTIRNEKLMVTTSDEAESHLETRLFPVRDLVLCQESGKQIDDYDSLITLIIQTISPQTWSDAGGPGCIEAFANGKVLVVSQTIDVQEQIVGLLSALRKAKQAQGMGALGNSGMIYFLIDDQSEFAKPDHFVADNVSELPAEAFPRRYPVLHPATWQIPRTH